jgi:glucose/arabinose dehydrogenase
LPFADSETPAVGVGTTYSIPEGNLFPVGTAKTRPEIYSMGHRNPYKVKIDSVSGFGLIGEVGPDAPGPDAAHGPTGSDEFNLLTGPGNYGWPFAIADNQPYTAFDGEAYPKGTVFDLKNLKNLSKANTGIEDLPPAIGALAYYNARNSQTGPNTVFASGPEAAISGPYYRYEESKPAVKMPAFFNGKFIVGDFSRSKVWLMELDESNKLKKVENLWNVNKVIDLNIGPDGDLYVMTLGAGGSYEGDPNSGSLYKMQYKGAQYAATACSQAVYVFDGQSRTQSKASRKMVDLASQNFVHAPAGATVGRLYDLKGQLLWNGRVQEGRLNLPGSLKANLGFLDFQ